MFKKRAFTVGKRQLVAFSLCSVLAVSLAACGKSDDPPQDTTFSASAPAQTERTTIPESGTTTTTVTTSPTTDETEQPSAVPVDSNTKAAILRTYKEAYNKTKAAGQLMGSDAISVLSGTLKLNGRQSALAESLINHNVNDIFGRGGALELPPTGPGFDVCALTEDDVKIASRRDDAGYTIIKIVPRDDGIPLRGQGGSGNLIEVVSIEEIKKLTKEQKVNFSEGRSFDECVTLEYLGAECTVKIEKATGLIVSAEFKSMIYAKAEYVNVAWFQNQTASATVCYEMHYPAKT